MEKEVVLPVYEVVEQDGAFEVHRNGRLLMTPAGNPYRLRSEAMARAVCLEWTAQGEKVDPKTMPISQLVATTLDVVSKERPKVSERIIAYTSSELLCHRAEHPEDLARKQHEVWQPIIDWCKGGFGVDFSLGGGVMPVRQQKETIETLKMALKSFDDYLLTGLSVAVDNAGSLILGLALAEGHLSAEEVFKAAELDVEYQARTWGKDPVTQARQNEVMAELKACERWFAMLRN